MGLSLSVLIALVLLLPGAAFLFAVTRLHSTTAPSTGLEQQLSLGLAVALIAAISAHLGMLVAIQGVTMIFPDIHRPNLVAVIQLLGAHTGPAAAGAPKALGEHPVCAGLYILVATTGMWFVGKHVNKKIQKAEPADWYQLLRPKDVDFVVLTADFVMGGETVLYKGVVLEFRIARTGDLERIVLGIAGRKPLAASSLSPQAQRAGSGPANEGEDDSSLGHGWIEIPGEKVVLQMKDAKTINLDYFWTSPSSPLSTVGNPVELDG